MLCARSFVHKRHHIAQRSPAPRPRMPSPHFKDSKLNVPHMATPGDTTAAVAPAPAGQPEQMTVNKIPTETQSNQPGSEADMQAQPVVIRETYKGSGKLQDKVAIISGADSGIGRSVAVHFAREGADVCIAYKDEHEDAKATQKMVETEGRKAILVSGDIGSMDTCKQIVKDTVDQLGKVNIVVNNASEQHTHSELGEVTPEELERTFRTNVFGAFFLTQAAEPHLQAGASVIVTSSITAFRGSGKLVPYSSTKAAQLGFVRALASLWVSKGIRVNAVAPGPIHTPLIPATFDKDQMESWKTEAPMGRPGQPCEVAPAYVFLASEDASYFSGQTMHPNGGTVVNT